MAKNGKKIADNGVSEKTLRHLQKYQKLAEVAVEKAQAENRRLGIPNWYSVNGKIVKVIKEKNPANCPWKELKIDIVVESTGNFDTREEVMQHLTAGAKKVIVTAPMKDGKRVRTWFPQTIEFRP